MAHKPLADKLKPVDEALARLKERDHPASEDIVAALSGLTEVVRELTQFKWSDDGGQP